MHFNGHSFALNFKKPNSVFSAKKCGVFFYIMCIVENSEARCDVVLLLLIAIWVIGSLGKTDQHLN